MHCILKKTRYVPGISYIIGYLGELEDVIKYGNKKPVRGWWEGIMRKKDDSGITYNVYNRPGEKSCFI